MKTNLLFTTLTVFGMVFSSNAQVVVFDPSVVSTLVVNHNVQNANLSQIKDNEGKIAATQLLITAQMETIKQLEQKMHNSLSTVQGVISSAKGIIRASEIVKEISQYQTQMIEIAGQDPELGLVAAKTEYMLVQRTSDLLEYIFVATIGGDVNLMNNKQRLDLITHVVDELRFMRGLAYTITRKMKRARYAGVFRYMIPDELRPVVNTAEIAEKTIREAKELLGQL